MGNFYTNFAVKHTDPQAVAEALRNAKRSALVSPTKSGYVVVYDEAADTQDPEEILTVGRHLSTNFDAPVFAILNHDDDVLCYWLFRGGNVVDEYNSCPEYFDDGEEADENDSPQCGGRSETLCTTLDSPTAVDKVREILEGEYTFALEQHAALVDALGLPNWSVGCGHTYLTQDEWPEGLSADSMIRVP